MEAALTATPNKMADKYEATLERLVRELEVRDLETQGHTFRVTGMAVRLAEAMGIQGEALLNVRRGALLHDIGKLEIPAYILHKEGRLGAAEMSLVRTHPQKAYALLVQLDLPPEAIDIPYCHHEKWDGTGYPRRLKAQQIPVSARLFAVVDVYDATTMNRTYRAAMPREEVFSYLRHQKGKHFDPEIVEIFLQLLSTS
jgi:putative nucleotidyltransferase with HDIG domain